MKEKKPEENVLHLRDLAVSLMTRRFGIPQKTEKRIKFKDYTDQRIGEVLDYDKSHIYRLLKNPDLRESQPLSPEAIKNIVIRLVTLDYNDVSEIDTPQWREQSDKMEQVKQASQTMKRRFLISLIGLIIVCLFLVFSIKRTHFQEKQHLNNELAQLQEDLRRQSDVFLIKNETRLGNIMQLYGDHIIDRLIWEGLDINREVREGLIVLRNNTDTLREIKLIERRIADIILTGRERLNKMGFVLPNGDKLGECINRVITYEKKGDRLVSGFIAESLQVQIPHLFNKDITPEKLKELIKEKTREDQRILWEEMKVCLDPSFQ